MTGSIVAVASVRHLALRRLFLCSRYGRVGRCFGGPTVGRRQNRLTTVTISGFCLAAFCFSVVVLHVLLIQYAGPLKKFDDADISGSGEIIADGRVSKSDNEAIPSLLPTGSSDYNDDESFLHPSDDRRSNVEFPYVYGCHDNDASIAESPIEFQPLGRDYLYTAYIDDRLVPIGPAYIRVLALMQRRSTVNQSPLLYGRVAWQNGSDVSVSHVRAADRTEASHWCNGSAELYEMCENHSQLYGGWIVSWRLPPSPQLHRNVQNADGAHQRLRRPAIACRIEVTSLSGSDDEIFVSLPLFRMRSEARQILTLPRHITRKNFVHVNAGRVKPSAKDKLENQRLDFAVCVPPLFGDVSPATLIQFVELGRLLGVDHFVFYVVSDHVDSEQFRQTISGENHPGNQTGRSAPIGKLDLNVRPPPVSASVRQVIDRYGEIGVATAIKWGLPTGVANYVWYNGQLLAANDCLYRTSHRFHYVAFIDLDEFILPRDDAVGGGGLTPASWKLMIEKIDSNWKSSGTSLFSSISEILGDVLLKASQLFASQFSLANLHGSREGHVTHKNPVSGRESSAFSSRKPSGYSFMSAFFPPVSLSSSISRGKTDYTSSFDVLLSNERSPLSKVRSKVIVRPEAVFEVGIHHISRPLYTLPVAQAAVDAIHAVSNEVTAAESSVSETVDASIDVVKVSPEFGLVHHYRNCVITFDVQMNCNRAAFVFDDRLERLGIAMPLKYRISRTLDTFLKLKRTNNSKLE